MGLLIVPVFNEEKYIKNVLKKIKKVKGNNQILVINDGSTDDTEKIVNNVGVDYYLKNERNIGCGNAIRLGFDFAISNNYNFVVTIDGDGQHNPYEMLKFIKLIQKYDVISGNRFSSKSPIIGKYPLERLLSNKLLNEIINKNTNYNLSDAFCGFKAYNKKAFKKLKLTLNGYMWPFELFIQADKNKLTVKEVPISLIYYEKNRNFEYYAKSSAFEANEYLSTNISRKDYNKLLLFFEKYVNVR